MASNLLTVSCTSWISDWRMKDIIILSNILLKKITYKLAFFFCYSTQACPELFPPLAVGHFCFSVLLNVHLNCFSLALMMQSTLMSVCVQSQVEKFLVYWSCTMYKVPKHSWGIPVEQNVPFDSPILKQVHLIHVYIKQNVYHWANISSASSFLQQVEMMGCDDLPTLSLLSLFNWL